MLQSLNRKKTDNERREKNIFLDIKILIPLVNGLRKSLKIMWDNKERLEGDPVNTDKYNRMSREWKIKYKRTSQQIQEINKINRENIVLNELISRIAQNWMLMNPHLFLNNNNNNNN